MKLAALLALLALLSADEGSPPPPAGPPTPPAPATLAPGAGELEPLSAEGRAALRALLSAGVHRDLLWPDFSGDREDARRFYAARGDALAWIRRSGPTEPARALAGILRKAEEMGLDPDDYDGRRWEARLAPGTVPASEAERIRLDVGLTISALRYVSDLLRGRVDPSSLRVGLGRAAAAEDPAELLHELAGAGDVQRVLARLEPPFAAYRRTLDALRTYLRLAREDPGEPLPVPAAPVEPGASYPGAQRLAELLRRVGDLREGPGEADEAGYGPALVEAVRRFQARHGLEPDGRLGAATVRALNVPLSRRVLQLALTLERWRSGPRSVAAPPIVVNIPEYRLRALDAAGRSALSMKVVVGAAYRHRTPILVAELTTVVFRPYWNVPASITRNELLPKLAKDPGLLARERYDVVDRRGGIVVGELTADVTARLRAGDLRLRQRPGPTNALALVKFVFPNAHDVYLHGTPSPRLFARSRRDFSHGCIRVEDPVALAGWVLRDRAPWSVAGIRAAMEGEETRVVDVAPPIPVLIVYGTAVVSETGEVRFLEDVYGHDATLERALARRRPYPD